MKRSASGGWERFTPTTGNNVQIGVPIENATQTLPHHRVVVDKEYSYWGLALVRRMMHTES